MEIQDNQAELQQEIEHLRARLAELETVKNTNAAGKSDNSFLINKSITLDASRLAANSLPDTSEYQDVLNHLLKLAQESSRQKTESLALLDTLLENAPIGLGFLDVNLRFARLNNALAVINGVSREAHLGRTIQEVLPDLEPEVAGLFKTVLHTGKAIIDREVSGETRAAPGQQRYWLSSYYPVNTSDGANLGVGVVVVEITERKRAEEMQSFLAEATSILSASLDYETLLTSLGKVVVPRIADWYAVDMPNADGVIQRLSVAHVDPAKVEWANEIQRRFPPNPDALTGVPNVMRTGQSEYAWEISEQALAAAIVDEELLEIIHKIGFTSYMIVPLVARGHTLGVITFVSAESGRHYGPTDLALAEDLARRAAMSVDNARLYSESQAAVRAQLELDLLKDQFMSIASHELRTPLTSIKGYTQLLQRNAARRENSPGVDPAHFERDNRIMITMSRQIEKMQQLINDMLDVSRIQNGQLELQYTPQVDMNELVREVVEQQQATTDLHEIIFQPASQITALNVDETRIEQVLNNLLSNAAKYSPEGTPVEVNLKLEAEAVIVSVRDYGRGINPEHQAHIFDRFYRVRSNDTWVDGLGLGLFISHQIIARHGGRMWLESQPGQGSIFYFSLPLAA